MNLTLPSLMERKIIRGEFILILGVDKESEDIAIYHYNEKTMEWELIGGEITDKKITVLVDHFPTYGVLRKVQNEGEMIISSVVKDENKKMNHFRLSQLIITTYY